MILISVLIFFVFSLESHAESVFKNETEFGYVVTGGNTDVSTLSAKQRNRWQGSRDAWNLDARYIRSSNQGLEQALQWGAGLKYERLLEEQFSLFAGQLLESNIYQSILQRYATDAGGKYYLQKREKEWMSFMELGYRYTRENYPSSFQNLHFARLYAEIEKYWFSNTSGKVGFEYLPNFSRWKGYQWNSVISVTGALSEFFSLKTSFEIRYNNEPPVGVKSNMDRLFTTALVAKF